MNLLVDIGNSAVKLAFEQGSEIVRIARVPYEENSLVANLQPCLAQLKVGEVRNIYISNVAGKRIAELISSWFQQNFKLTPQFATTLQKQRGLENAYITPGTLGIDRWLAMLAACDCFDGPKLVVDCGTAVTLDAINDKREFIGGLILPGLNLMRQSLATSADAINHAETSEFHQYFATSTETGVVAGTAFSIASLIEKMVMALNNIAEKDAVCILTGGNAQIIESYLSIPVVQEPNLVLKGLSIYFRQD